MLSYHKSIVQFLKDTRKKKKDKTSHCKHFVGTYIKCIRTYLNCRKIDPKQTKAYPMIIEDKISNKQIGWKARALSQAGILLLLSQI